MKVVLDANQYVSAVLKPESKSAQLVQLELKEGSVHDKFRATIEPDGDAIRKMTARGL